MKDIVQRDNPILREKARTVRAEEIDSGKFRDLIADMKSAMHSQKDGVAIAAPQLGVPLRVFVVSGERLSQADKTYKGEKADLVFVNPEIVKLSKEKEDLEEGCLSVRWLYGRVMRSTRVTLRALDLNGEKVERGASGVLAQIFQHECDHLEGVLFTDKASEIWEMSEEEVAELMKK